MKEPFDRCRHGNEITEPQSFVTDLKGQLNFYLNEIALGQY